MRFSQKIRIGRWTWKEEEEAWYKKRPGKKSNGSNCKVWLSAEEVIFPYWVIVIILLPMIIFVVVIPSPEFSQLVQEVRRCRANNPESFCGFQGRSHTFFHTRSGGVVLNLKELSKNAAIDTRRGRQILKGKRSVRLCRFPLIPTSNLNPLIAAPFSPSSSHHVPFISSILIEAGLSLSCPSIQAQVDGGLSMRRSSSSSSFLSFPFIHFPWLEYLRGSPTTMKMVLITVLAAATQ